MTGSCGCSMSGVCRFQGCFRKLCERRERQFSSRNVCDATLKVLKGRRRWKKRRLGFDWLHPWICVYIKGIDERNFIFPSNCNHVKTSEKFHKLNIDPVPQQQLKFTNIYFVEGQRHQFTSHNFTFHFNALLQGAKSLPKISKLLEICNPKTSFSHINNTQNSF